MRKGLNGLGTGLLQLSYGGVADLSRIAGRLEEEAEASYVLLPAAASGKDLSLPVGIPAGGTELDGGMGEPVDGLDSPVDDHSTIRTGICRDLRPYIMYFDHHET